MSKKNRVTHLTSVHPRFDTRVFHKELTSLQKNGFETTLIVADGEPDDITEGVKIINVGRKRSRFSRIFISTFLVMVAAFRQRSDIYHFHDPELIPVGLILKLFRKTVIYDIHENVGLQLKTRNWVPSILKTPLCIVVDIVEGFACRFFDALVVPQPSMKDKFQKYSKTEMVANFVESENLDATVKTENQDFTIFHPGALSKERGLFSMLEIADKWKGGDIVLAGGFSDAETERLAKAHPGWNSITFLGRLSKSEVREWYKKSHLGVILYQNVGQYYLAYAIKLFEYMERGIPVIMPNFGEWVSFCEENKCGVCVDVTNIEEIIGSINKMKTNSELAHSLGRAGRESIENKYDWRFAEIALINLYREIV